MSKLSVMWGASSREVRHLCAAHWHPQCLHEQGRTCASCMTSCPQGDTRSTFEVKSLEGEVGSDHQVAWGLRAGHFPFLGCHFLYK